MKTVRKEGVSRRWFIGSALSFGAAAGCRTLETAGGAFAGLGANLALGVISDVHLDAGAGDFCKFGDATTLVHALEWFRDQGVDGVILAGDMADNGMRNQLQCVADAWYRVFPNDKAPDGRRVEKLFVYGNHDLEGQRYDDFANRYHHRPSLEAQFICASPARAWQDAFHEPYAPIWKKTVKGYQVIGSHWVDWSGVPGVEGWFVDHAKEIDETKPFFYVQHCHPKDTCHGPKAWGADKGYATRALTPYPNAIAFTGHSHTSLTDEKAIWQGAFTSIGTSSLRFGSGPDPQKWDARQGQLVRVYDEYVTVCRRDFLNDLPLGPDWTFPVTTAAKKPYAFAERARKSVPPEFAAGAALAVRPAVRKNPRSAVRKGEPAEWAGWEVTIPAAVRAKGGSRTWDYGVTAEGAAGAKKTFAVMSRTFNAAPARGDRAATVAFVKADDLGGALTRVTVRPRDCFGNAGRALETVVAG